MARILNGGFRPKVGDRIQTSKGPRIVEPLSARYATPPPKAELVWLETSHFVSPDGETVLLAWPRKAGFTFRTGRFDGRRYILSDDTVPFEQPTFYAPLK